MKNQPQSQVKTTVKELSKSETTLSHTRRPKLIRSWILSWLNNYFTTASVDARLTGQEQSQQVKVCGRVAKQETLPTQVVLTVEDGFGAIKVPITKRYNQNLPEILEKVPQPLFANKARRLCADGVERQRVPRKNTGFADQHYAA